MKLNELANHKVQLTKTLTVFYPQDIEAAVLNGLTGTFTFKDRSSGSVEVVADSFLRAAKTAARRISQSRNTAYVTIDLVKIVSKDLNWNAN